MQDNNSSNDSPVFIREIMEYIDEGKLLEAKILFRFAHLIHEKDSDGCISIYELMEIYQDNLDALIIILQSEVFMWNGTMLILDDR